MSEKGIRLGAESASTKPVFWNYSNDPHLLVMGDVGTGKTVLLENMIYFLDAHTQHEAILIHTLPMRINPTRKTNVLVSETNVLVSDKGAHAALEILMKRISERLDNPHREKMLPLFIFIEDLKSVREFNPETFKLVSEMMQRILLDSRQANIYVIAATISDTRLFGAYWSNFARFKTRYAQDEFYANSHSTRDLTRGELLFSDVLGTRIINVSKPLY